MVSNPPFLTSEDSHAQAGFFSFLFYPKALKNEDNNIFLKISCSRLAVFFPYSSLYLCQTLHVHFPFSFVTISIKLLLRKAEPQFGLFLPTELGVV